MIMFSRREKREAIDKLINNIHSTQNFEVIMKKNINLI